MPFIRRFVINPGDAVLNDVPSVNIIDQAPQGSIVGLNQSTVGIVGEFVKGPYATPTLEGSYASVKNDFGGFNAGIGDGDLSANGNGVAQLSGLTWGNLVIIRANLEVGQVTFTLSAVTTAAILIPAGSRVKTAAGHIYLTDQDLTIPGTTGNLTGTVGVTPYNAADFTGGDIIAAINTVVDSPSGLGTVTISVSNSAAVTELTPALIVTAYQNAINTTLVYDGSPGSHINIIFSARKDTLSAQPTSGSGTVEPIRAALISNANTFSLNGGPSARNAVTIGHRGTVKQQAIYCKQSSQAAYGLTDEREFFEDLAVKWNSPEAGSMLEITSDAFMASILSQLPPWENPGQATPYTAGILGLESSLGESYGVNDYVTFVANGINAFIMDQYTGPQFIQGFTGVNQSVYAANKRITRRRMADYIEGSIALGTAAIVKKLSTPKRRDSVMGEVVSFLEGELSRNYPENSHIAGYTVDDVSANTAEILASGQFNIIVSVQTYASLDAITFLMTVGENVTVNEQI
jgi:hypothetical protein